MTELKSLANHFLIAMPSMEDPFFARSLTYICEHNDEGAMGLVVNHPTNMTLRELLEQAEKGAEIDDEKGQQIVLSGGPVSQERGVYPAFATTWLELQFIAYPRNHGDYVKRYSQCPGQSSRTRPGYHYAGLCRLERRAVGRRNSKQRLAHH